MFEYFPGRAIYPSLDMLHWQRIGYAVDRPEPFAALHSEHLSLYACTSRCHDGTLMSPLYHYDLCKTMDAGKPYVVLLKLVDDMNVIAPVGDGPLLLRIESAPLNFKLSTPRTMVIGMSSERRSETAGARARDRLSDTYIGMFSVSAGTAQQADFDWFDYHAQGKKDKL